MAQQNTTNVTPERFSEHKDLSYLVCEAGIELDNLLTGYSDSVKAITELATVLKHSGDSASSAQKAFPMDMRKSLVAKWAIADSLPKYPHVNAELPGEQGNEKKMLRSISDKLAVVAENPASAQKDAELSNLRDFCSSLIDSISVREQWSQIPRPVHPWRK